MNRKIDKKKKEKRENRFIQIEIIAYADIRML